VEEVEEKTEDRGDEGVGGGGFREVGVVVVEEIKGRREMDKRQ
jgi:hypothetical protein